MTERDAMAQGSADYLIRAYLQDAFAAEKNFEAPRAFSKEGDDRVAHAVFSAHAQETRLQDGKLEARQDAIGGSSSAMKTMLAHMIGTMPKAAQIGHEKEKRTVQNLTMADRVENAEVAMYEALATVAHSADEFGSGQLARSVEQEERETARKIWQDQPVAAREAFAR